MAILKAQPIRIQKPLRARIDTTTIEKIEQYCQWADINSTGDFIELASQFVFDRDKAWRRFQESSSPHSEDNRAE